MLVMIGRTEDAWRILRYQTDNKTYPQVRDVLGNHGRKKNRPSVTCCSTLLTAGGRRVLQSRNGNDRLGEY